MTAWPARLSFEARRSPVVRVGDVVYPVEATCEIHGKHGAPNATLQYRIRDGETECVSAVITAQDNGRAVQDSDFAALHIADRARQTYARFALSVRDTCRGDNGGPVEHYNEQVPPLARRKRTPITDELLKQVAADYRAYVDDDPVQFIAERHGLTERTAARRVQRARARGFLPPTTPGKKRG